MLAGLVGLTLGAIFSQTLKPKFPRIDPIICATGLILSAPLLFATTYASTKNTTLCYILLFFGQVTLNLNWAIVGDILLVRSLEHWCSCMVCIYCKCNYLESNQYFLKLSVTFHFDNAQIICIVKMYKHYLHQ